MGMVILLVPVEAEVGGAWLVDAVDALCQLGGAGSTTDSVTNILQKSCRRKVKQIGTCSRADLMARCSSKVENVDEKRHKICCRTLRSDKSEIQNRFLPIELEDDGDESVEVNVVTAEKLIRTCGMIFIAAPVHKPLASAVRVCQAGYLIVMDPGEDKSYVGNVNTGEKMKIRMEKGTFVFDVEYEGGEPGAITLDSGAICRSMSKYCQRKTV